MAIEAIKRFLGIGQEQTKPVSAIQPIPGWEDPKERTALITNFNLQTMGEIILPEDCTPEQYVEALDVYRKTMNEMNILGLL